MNIIKSIEFYNSDKLSHLGMLDMVDLLDKMVSFLDVEYDEVYDPFFQCSEIDVHIDKFLEAFKEYDRLTNENHKELKELYEIALIHSASGEEELHLEF